MANLTVQNVSHAGLSPAFDAADVAGDTFANDGEVFLVVQNGGAAQITATVTAQRKCDQGFLHDITVDVPAGDERWIGEFDIAHYNDSANKVHVAYTDVGSVTVAAVRT